MVAKNPCLLVALLASSRAAPTARVPSTLVVQAQSFHDRNSDLLHYSECCGMIHEPACTYENTTLSQMTHSCFSEARPTIGAVRAANGTYVCAVCGRPNGPACECTFDNEANKHDHGNLTLELEHKPCQGKLEHWCLDGPEYFPTQDETGVFEFVCVLNETDDSVKKAEPMALKANPNLLNSTQLTEHECGLFGERACLDPDTLVHSCASPGPKGEDVRAMPFDESDPNTPIVCLACGHKGVQRCPEQHPEDDLFDLPERTCTNEPTQFASLSSDDAQVPPSSGLSAGAITGIVIGSFAGVGTFAWVAWVMTSR